MIQLKKKKWMLCNKIASKIHEQKLRKKECQRRNKDKNLLFLLFIIDLKEPKFKRNCSNNILNDYSI